MAKSWPNLTKKRDPLPEAKEMEPLYAAAKARLREIRVTGEKK